MYTTHGHHIPGTDVDGAPETVVRCGGLKLCRKCNAEALFRLELSSSLLPYSAPESTVEVRDIDSIIALYANKAHEIYVDRTAGDYTWTGFLAAFLADVKGLDEYGRVRLDAQKVRLNTNEAPENG